MPNQYLDAPVVRHVGFGPSRVTLFCVGAGRWTGHQSSSGLDFGVFRVGLRWHVGMSLSPTLPADGAYISDAETFADVIDELDDYLKSDRI